MVHATYVRLVYTRSFAGKVRCQGVRRGYIGKAYFPVKGAFGSYVLRVLYGPESALIMLHSVRPKAFYPNI